MAIYGSECERFVTKESDLAIRLSERVFGDTLIAGEIPRLHTVDFQTHPDDQDVLSKVFTPTKKITLSHGQPPRWPS